MTIPTSGSRLRWVLIICALSMFLWLSPEDQQVWPVVLLAAAGVLSGMAFWVTRRFGGQHIGLRWVPLSASVLGAIVGVGISLTAALLMLLKNVHHSHFYLDYPPGLILDVLALFPVWSAAGALLGLAAVLVWMAYRR